jgi:hypothetical protein
MCKILGSALVQFQHIETEFLPACVIAAVICIILGAALLMPVRNQSDIIKILMKKGKFMED